VFLVTQESLPAYHLWALNKGFKVKPFPRCQTNIEGIIMTSEDKITDWPIWERGVESQLTKEDIDTFNRVTRVTPNFRFRGLSKAFEAGEYMELISTLFPTERDPDVLQKMSELLASGGKRIGDFVRRSTMNTKIASVVLNVV
jgi:hypothetical protein